MQFGQVVFIGAGTLAAVGVYAMTEYVTRRRDVARFADVYGCFDQVPRAVQRADMKIQCYEYSNSLFLRQLMEDPPFHLLQVFDGVDFEDDPPCSAMRKDDIFLDLNRRIIMDAPERVMSSND